jgi:hypothetical protein
MLYQVAVPIIQPRMRFFDADGKPLVGGKVYSFKVGTELFKPTYRDAQKTALNTNPIVLDSDGSALIYLSGAHVLKVYDKNGNFIEERYLPETQMKTQFFDKLGVPLKNGKVWTYDISSTIKKTSYANADKNQPNANPVVLDAEGWASISMIGSYRLRSYNEKGVSTGDQDFKRPAAKALTSKVYPVYFTDQINVDFEINVAVQKIVINSAGIAETMLSSFALNKAISRSIYNSFNTMESTRTSFALNVAIKRQTSNVASMQESTSSSFSLNRVKKINSVVTNTQEIHSIKSSFSLQKVIKG